ncbi:cell division control protein 54 [Purpureocillium lavendulum]|uniref:Cell division control protein 54 n=1 Tax=Purpureocillium lavendulum TaxID=1247861 RepID=A0AB34G5H2_9HYPO|nr:cell division control protein 54 [Purpureocillium lavendulum]
MRFTSVIFAGALALVASAQSDATPTRSLSPAEASAAACLKACKPGDVNCQSHCITVPNPDENQVNATNKCVAACPQGDGSPAQTDKYSQCVQKCIADNYYVSSAGTPKATGGSGNSDNSGSSSGSDASQTTGGSGGSGGSGSASGTGATATQSGTAGASGSGTAGGSSSTSTGLAPIVTAAPAAVVGLVAAVLAL